MHRGAPRRRGAPASPGRRPSPIKTQRDDAQRADETSELVEVGDPRSRGLAALRPSKWIVISAGFGEAFSLGVNFAPLHLPWFADLLVMLGAPSIGMLVAAYAYRIMRASDRAYRHSENEDHLKLIELLVRGGVPGYCHDRRHDGESVEFHGERAGHGRAPTERPATDPMAIDAGIALSPGRRATTPHDGTPDPPRHEEPGGTPVRHVPRPRRESDLPPG